MAEGNPIGAVGYRRPPRNRQFKPGQSGNPTGRPKGAKNFATALAEELDAPITATENGKRKTISNERHWQSNWSTRLSQEMPKPSHSS
jgi:Family of unknown function (DUF5681)